MTPKEQYYKYGESLGISINDLQRLKMLADNCQEDMADNNLSNEVLFKQAIVAMEEHYGYGCETEIDAYFRGLKWMQKQYNKQD